MSKSVKEAFEALFIPEPNSGCWLWFGNRFSPKRGGYGCFTSRPNSVMNARAHRVSFELYCRPITSEEHVLHSCDNPLCVNPDHLSIGDQRSNMGDKVAKRRQDRGEAHGMAKLKAAEVLAIRADPRRHADIASDYDISFVTVSDIKRRKSWAHL